MKWLVDIDAMVAEGVLSPATAEELKRRNRAEALGLGVSLFLIGGILAVLAGVVALAPQPATVTATGAAVALAAVLLLARFDARLALIANAGAVIGLAMLGLGTCWWLVERGESLAPAAVAGGLALALGLLARVRLPAHWAGATGWLAVLGMALHLAGLVALLAPEVAPWGLVLWTAVLLLATGAILDIRLLTALSVVALAQALSATGYERALYWLEIREPVVLTGLMAAVGLAALAVTATQAERLARHARIAGLMAVIWMNLALWVGSIWGDVVGATLWGPQPGDPAGDEARSAFLATATVVADWQIALVWAGLLAVLGVWSAATARRSIFNACATFGAIHFYTQWFERLEADPARLIAGGVLAILIAWGMVRVNAWMGRRAGARS